LVKISVQKRKVFFRIGIHNIRNDIQAATPPLFEKRIYFQSDFLAKRER
jgi:hypothetical protein